MSPELVRQGDYRRWVTAMSQALESGDEPGFRAALSGFDSVRDSLLLTGVRRVTGDLRAALDRLRVDSKLVELAQRQVPDARQRLAHVLKLTHAAAHRTLDLVEQSGPIVEATARAAQRLSQERPPRDAAAIQAFLEQTVDAMAILRQHLAEVLVTQEYQDLTGQILRSVETLVEELELALGELTRITEAEPGAAESAADLTRSGHGPRVPGVAQGNAVSDQQDVDALLSDLGM
jgi:chemotaxis protein CheZ